MQPAEYTLKTDSSSVPKPSVSELLGELAEHSTQLVKKEGQLLLFELRKKVSTYRLAAIKVAVGVGVIFLSLIAISIGVINLLSYYWGLTTAAFVYGCLLLLIGALFVLNGLSANPSSSEVTEEN